VVRDPIALFGASKVDATPLRKAANRVDMPLVWKVELSCLEATALVLKLRRLLRSYGACFEATALAQKIRRLF
jgi:hypothetical protein